MSKKKKYVKLGDKASSFYDPTTKMNVKKGQGVEVELKHRQSKRFNRALKTGHLDYVDSDEREELRLIDAIEVKKEVKKEPETAAWKKGVEYTEKGLKGLKVAQLRELAMDELAKNSDFDMTEAEIETATKNEIIPMLLLDEEEDEEDDEVDDEEDDEEDED